jgi:hypothetical protein
LKFLCLGGGLQSKIQREIKRPGCRWEAGVAGRGGPTPAPAVAVD